MKSFGIIIPARYASTRLPGKPLLDIEGKSLIQRVYENSNKIKEAQFCLVATDDDRIFNHVNQFGKAIMTRKDHISGTDRINQSLENITDLPDVIVNVQGDEPFLNSQVILDLIRCFDKPNCEIATAYYDIGQEEAESPNMVKLVTNHEGRAHYFSRSKIPFPRIGNPSYKAHMGIYAYKTTILKSICNLAPSHLEQTESLEQLRWLENGLSIFCIKSETKSLGIDTKEDLIKAKELIKKGV